MSRRAQATIEPWALGQLQVRRSTLIVSIVRIPTARSLFPLFSTRGGHSTKYDCASVIHRSVVH